MDSHTLARTTDPATSHEAAASLPDVRAHQRAVLRLLGQYGPTTDERLLHLANLTGLHISPSGLRTRRHELVTQGLVEDTGHRATGSTGRRAIVWGVTS